MLNLKNVKIALLVQVSCLFFACSNGSDKPESLPAKVKDVEYAFVIHGGAGTITRENMTQEKEKDYRTALNRALDIGQNVLRQGGTAMDAVCESIKYMENSPLFNAGKGAVFTYEGRNEMDASIMRGVDLEAGAVGGVSNIKNPINAARLVLEKSDHVMLVGKGAERFAEINGIENAEPSYFYTQRRWNSIQRLLESEQESSMIDGKYQDYKYGTVGAVALDKYGDIVAGTSTGGMTGKKFNRIGDSPVIGAGTYANNKTCGVSCTGHGEFFIRYAVAYDVSAMMEYKGSSLETAANYVVNEKLKSVGGSGGLIALDSEGNVSMPFNTAGMYRGFVNDKERFVGIYSDEK
ncbi:MAG: isoaspartyl peptidase/L-asparaginase [Saprospiraceae bacterium]|nr:isoaspartyl peptidase/L-asparaginase [Saprospiraceae bacterium]